MAAAETLTVAADLSELRRVGIWVAELGARLALPDKTVFALDLCLEEALSNIIRHGGGAAKAIELNVARAADLVSVIITDTGPAFDPSVAAAPLPAATVEEAEIGGLGIQLIRKFATTMSYCRRGDVNELSLTFALE
jgi:sigma-B regulation protein RsbU (phosphoserine phosphatase)